MLLYKISIKSFHLFDPVVLSVSLEATYMYFLFEEIKNLILAYLPPQTTGR